MQTENIAEFINGTWVVVHKVHPTLEHRIVCGKSTKNRDGHGQLNISSFAPTTAECTCEGCILKSADEVTIKEFESVFKRRIKATSKHIKQASELLDGLLEDFSSFSEKCPFNNRCGVGLFACINPRNEGRSYSNCNYIDCPISA